MTHGNGVCPLEGSGLFRIDLDDVAIMLAIIMSMCYKLYPLAVEGSI